jgi:hypothetical protein
MPCSTDHTEQHPYLAGKHIATAQYTGKDTMKKRNAWRYWRNTLYPAPGPAMGMMTKQTRKGQPDLKMSRPTYAEPTNDKVKAICISISAKAKQGTTKAAAGSWSITLKKRTGCFMNKTRNWNRNTGLTIRRQEIQPYQVTL